MKQAGYHPMDYYLSNPELKAAIDRTGFGYFSNGDTDLFQPLVDSLLYDDEYLLLVDYPSFIDCQERAEDTYRDEETWTRMSILNVARCGYFSSDRTMKQYSQDIWGVGPVEFSD